MSQSVTLVNGYYPLDYFAITNIDQPNAVDPSNFWASEEALPPSSEYLIFDLGAPRPINYIDWDMTAKPIDILIEYFDGTNWQIVVDDPTFDNLSSVGYFNTSNSWIYIERHFQTITTQQIRITFIRRTEPFPFFDSDLFPWSIEVRNLRIISIVDNVDEFIPDNGSDILGNSYRTDIVTYDAANLIDGDDTTVWRSQPNPTPFAVEAVYFDLRLGSHVGTQSFTEEWEQDELDQRSQADLENYFSDTVVIDEVFVDPITFGPTMHIYYSNDDNADWDLKLWTPVNRHYILKKGFHSLPTSLSVKYVKLEFSNLAPRPYQTPEYPTLPPMVYRKYPTWVQNYFQDTFLGVDSVSSFADPYDRVTIDPLVLGFTRPNDLLNSGLDTRNAPMNTNTTIELSEFIQGIVTNNTTDAQSSQTTTEDQIQFNPPSAFQTDLTQQLDQTRALVRLATKDESGWNAEAAMPPVVPPSIQSVPDLTAARNEKQMPMMWFPYTCRHGYQTIRGSRPKKIAYYVGLKSVSFHRRDYTVAYDEDFYIETFGDTAHIAGSDFIINDWQYVVGETGFTEA